MAAVPTSRALLVQRISATARRPECSRSTGAVDFFACEPMTVAPGRRALLALGWKVAIPRGFLGRLTVTPRLALQNWLEVCGGPIWSDDDGGGGAQDLTVLVHNHHATRTCTIQAGDRLLRLALERIAVVACVREVDGKA